jgi:hypothetical protein
MNPIRPLEDLHLLARLGLGLFEDWRGHRFELPAYPTRPE